MASNKPDPKPKKHIREHIIEARDARVKAMKEGMTPKEAREKHRIKPAELRRLKREGKP